MLSACAVLLGDADAGRVAGGATPGHIIQPTNYDTVRRKVEDGEGLFGKAKMVLK